MQVEWTKSKKGTKYGTKYEVLEGSFRWSQTIICSMTHAYPDKATQADLPMGCPGPLKHYLDYHCARVALVFQKRFYALSRDLFGVLQSRTPCFGRLYDALPEESRTARVKLVVPQGASADTDLVVHLAGTGDHGFERRLHLGFPLVKQVCPPRTTCMSLRGWTGVTEPPCP